MNDTPETDKQTRTEIEAEVCRKLFEHLRNYPDVQNIDLMNLAYFCRNCMSRWYRTAAAARGVELSDDQAREIVYGMPYAEYKRKHKEPATDDQLEAFKEAEKKATPCSDASGRCFDMTACRSATARGLGRKSFIPAAKHCVRSRSEVLAVTATIGTGRSMPRARS